MAGSLPATGVTSPTGGVRTLIVTWPVSPLIAEQPASRRSTGGVPSHQGTDHPCCRGAGCVTSTFPASFSFTASSGAGDHFLAAASPCVERRSALPGPCNGGQSHRWLLGSCHKPSRLHDRLSFSFGLLRPLSCIDSVAALESGEGELLAGSARYPLYLASSWRHRVVSLTPWLFHSRLLKGVCPF